MWFFKKNKFGKGALIEPIDDRDYLYDEIAMGAAPVDWKKGYDVEKEISSKIPFENQNGSSSCVGQAWSYYSTILDTKENGFYDKQSAKAIYSQIYIPGRGGAYIREGGKLLKSWGSLPERIVPSYNNGVAPKEDFMRKKDWKTDKMDTLAKILQAKDYRVISASRNMDLFATAIRDNLGVVSGVDGTNDGTWNTLNPKPPEKTTWRHALYFGKFGTDEKGKYIATPNSWGNRFGGKWQKLREDYFESGHMFNAWTLTDKPNNDMNFRLIQQEGETTVWFVGQDGKRRFFFDEDQYNEIAPILGIPVDFSNLEKLSKEEIEKIPRGKPLVVIK